MIQPYKSATQEKLHCHFLPGKKCCFSAFLFRKPMPLLDLCPTMALATAKENKGYNWSIASPASLQSFHFVMEFESGIHHA